MLRTIVSVAALLAIGVPASVAHARSVAVAQSCGSGFGGEWATNYGALTITVNGDSVTGTYPTYSGQLKGRRLADAIEVEYADTSGTGTARFVFSADKKSFYGSWISTTGQAGLWNGICAAHVRVLKGGATPVACKPNLEGTWQTSYGAVTFVVSGKTITGSYPTYSGTVSGWFDGKSFDGQYKDTSGEGKVHFDVSADGRRFGGTWTASGGGGGAWTGECQ